MTNRKAFSILIAEDDVDDQLLVREAYHACHLTNDLQFVQNGIELLDYLYRRNQFTDPRQSPRPGLILLDLNMPRVDGRQALAEIKADPNLRQIPVVILTVTKTEEEILHCYDLNAAGFITKPDSFEGLVEVLRTIGKYWFQIVELPHHN